MRVGRAVSAVLAPGYSCCERCGTAWKFVSSRTVDYEFVDVQMPDGSILKDFPQFGHFALCEECWDECDADERVKFHMEALARWVSDGDEEKAAKIIAGVRMASSEPHETQDEGQ